MIDYDKIISQWKESVTQYCAHRSIRDMELRNLRTDDVYDYALYVVYKQAKAAVEMYRDTPSSMVYAAEMVRAIKQWYIAITDSRLQKMSMKVMTNDMFARFVTRTK